MKIFQTSSLFETNKFHHGGPPFSGGPGSIAPVAPPLIRPWMHPRPRVPGHWHQMPFRCYGAFKQSLHCCIDLNSTLQLTSAKTHPHSSHIPLDWNTCP